MIPNTSYRNLKDSYLFYNIAQKIKALHEGVNDQADKNTFHGYMPECGEPVLRGTIANYYTKEAARRLVELLSK